MVTRNRIRNGLLSAARYAALVLSLVPWACADAGETLSLIPWPKAVQAEGGSLALPPEGRIVADDAKLRPLADVLAEEIWRLSGRRLAIARGPARAGDIVLQFEPGLKDQQHTLTVDEKATARGGTYRGVAWATVTLVQALKIDGDKLSLPTMAVRDEPDIKLRSAMCDIARKWHPIANLYELVDLFRFYKLDHIQFHVNDHGMFTFGSRKFPRLPSFQGPDRRHYTIEELKALVAYADARAVTIIPEIEMPGHSDAARDMPEVFGTRDAATGQYKSSGYVNITRDDTVAACGQLLEEVMDVFASSELISIGADEVADGAFAKMAEYAHYKQTHAETPMMHFIAAMNEVAGKRGKTLMVYGRGGPRDVVQMPWTGNDAQLIKDGYKVLPYMAGSVTHHMPTLKKPPYNTIMLYSSFKTAYSADFTKDRKIAPENYDSIYGVHILTWQHWHFMHFHDLRKTMASVSQNFWNYNTRNSFQPFEQWRDNVWAYTDRRLDDLVFPVKAKPEGLLNPNDWTFYQIMQVKLVSPRAGTIRYRKEPLDFWRPPALPAAESPAYEGPITITEPTVIYAALFDSAGKRIGYGTEVRYWPIEPKVLCTIYDRGTLKEGVTAEQAKSGAMPDPNLFVPVDTVPLGWLTHTPSHRGMFMNSHFTAQQGRIRIPADADYRFFPRGPADLWIDGSRVAGVAEVSKRPQGKPSAGESNPVQLKAGLHEFMVVSQTHNSERVMEYIGPGSKQPRPFDELIVLLPEFENSVMAAAEGLTASGDAGILSDNITAPAANGFASQVKLTLTSTVAGQQIRWTRDGSPPSAQSAVFDKPIVIADSATVMAQRSNTQGKPVGYVWRQTYDRRPFVVRVEGTVGPQDSRFGKEAKLSMAPIGNAAGHVVRYTLDGGEPSATSLAVSGPIVLDKTAQVRARMFDASGMPAGSQWEKTFKQVDYDPENLICNRPVTTSGGENDGFHAGFAADGIVDISQYWGAQPAPRWWQTDLGQSRAINEVHVHTWWGDGRHYQFKVAVSVDGERWTDVVDASANTAPATPEGYRHRFDPAPARYIRVTMLKNSANPAVHLVEVRAFEANDPK